MIQTRNDYNVLWECEDGSSGLGVFNGDIGILKAISPEEKNLTVDFDGRTATYDFEALSDLEHAWALTVHKAQGSEYRAVVLALSDSSRRLLTRTVLYTAVTRARELLIMVGNENIAFRMIDNIAPSRRYNALRIRIRNGNVIRLAIIGRGLFTDFEMGRFGDLSKSVTCALGNPFNGRKCGVCTQSQHYPSHKNGMIVHTKVFFHTILPKQHPTRASILNICSF